MAVANDVRVALVLGGGAEVTDELGDIRWSAFAFHEQDAVELDGDWAVEVLSAFVWAERGGGRWFGHGPGVGECLQGACVALQANGQLAGCGGVELLVLAVKLGQVEDRVQKR